MLFGGGLIEKFVGRGKNKNVNIYLFIYFFFAVQKNYRGGEKEIVGQWFIFFAVKQGGEIFFGAGPKKGGGG